MGAATSVAAQRADATVVELAPAAAVSAEAPAPGAADGPTGAPAVDRLALLAQQLDGSEEFLEAVASEAAPVRAVLQELGSGRFDGGDGDESPAERRRRRVSVLLESEDLDGLERELRSMKISDALYASVMGGVRTVLSFGFPRSRPADAPLELQLVKGKLARLEEDYAKLREENARLRLAAGQTSRDLRDRASTTRATFLKACAALPYGSSDPAAVRDWLDAHVTSRAENDVERQRFAAVAAQLFESGADGPSLLGGARRAWASPPGSSCGRLGPLQDFEWEALLGDGSFGQVHRCRNKHSGDPRAVKVVHVASGDLERAALEMEFQQVAGARGDQARRRRRELHARKLVHRDLKPENVLLTAAGDVRLADLGLARALRDEAPETMTVAGTLNYMAPELLAGKRASAKADTWSLAVIFFEMRTGSLPVHDDERAGDAVAEWARVGGTSRTTRVPALRPRARRLEAAPERRRRRVPAEPGLHRGARARKGRDDGRGDARRASRGDDAATAEETRTRASRASRASRDDDAPPRAVVVDLGSATVKVGLSGGAAASFRPSSAGRHEVKALAELALSALKSPRSHGGPPPATSRGDDAVGKRGVLALRTPLARGLVVDWEGLELIFAHTFYSEVGVEPGAQPLLLAESPLNRRRAASVAALVFDVFEVPSLYVNAQAVLSLYASGRTTGCAVDAAGRDVTAHLERLLAAAGARLDGDVVCDVKEKLAYVALDYDAELELAEADVASAYELPDGDVVTVGRARFTCAEMLFDPARFGLRETGLRRRASGGGVHDVIHAAICRCEDRAVVKELCANVVVAGGTTLLPGFPERLATELLRLRKTSTHRVKVKIVAPPDRHRRVWTGGSLLASLEHFPDMCTTRDEYAELGPAAVHRHCERRHSTRAASARELAEPPAAAPPNL
ncbi:hypothetical protein JL720_15353 [Aureococcus anophagefferens]|nr:hypothetical protein JL720_15353 [Aureococcus anophagefferens]